MPDTSAAGISTAGEDQVKELKKISPNIKVDISLKGQHSVLFGDNPETASLGSLGVNTLFGRIHFAIVPVNTSFLICLSDMDRHGVYLNNVENISVHKDKKYIIVRKWGHPWFLLEYFEKSIAWSLTETELHQLHRRFPHPAVEIFYKVLKPSRIR